MVPIDNKELLVDAIFARIKQIALTDPRGKEGLGWPIEVMERALEILEPIVPEQQSALHGTNGNGNRS